MELNNPPAPVVMCENKVAGSVVNPVHPENVPANILAALDVTLANNPDGIAFAPVKPVHPKNVLENISVAPDTFVPLKSNRPLGIDVNPVHPENVLANIYSPLPDKLANNVYGLDVKWVQPSNV